MDASIAIRLHTNDDVVIATRQLMPGNTIPGETCTVRDLIPPGHKVAAHDIAAGAPVRRYNQIIGFAKEAIAAGAHVHVKNLTVGEFERDYAIGTAKYEPAKVAEPASFMGYKRPNGKVGTRNYIGVVASVNCSATVVRAIANHFNRERLAAFPHVDGVVPMPHPLGCGMNSAGEGMLALRRTMVGYAQHPNFAGILFVGLCCEMNQVQPLIEEIGAYEPGMLDSVNIQDLGGTSKAIAKGIELVEAMLPKANSYVRSPAPISHLIVGLNCGGSDGYSGITANPALGGAVDLLVAHGATAVLAETPEIYGAEHLLTRRAATPEIAEKLIGRIAWWKHYTSVNGGEMDNNPSVGNKAGGLTTILEKSLGAVAKGGTTTLNGVFEYAELITAKGFVYMDTPGYDPVSVTGLAAGGAQIVCFTTGRGSAFGCAGVPTLKLATNNALWERQREDMDINCGDLLDGVSMQEISRRIFDSIILHASGEKCRSEVAGYGNDEFLPWQIGAVM
ncbi:MAG: galactonate dehydratase [Candidatus Dactylopiibacterium carminicum]|uniref:Altronate dehydratase n=1 Tax=Candidatus Dactylopiibacterium carminicum TaxID=857335 RepID=A0A272ETL5_9RHOO|nr:altronate dehydratase family protein [Candidatus Dactylopiibacterium carminicum]KAF7599410.1 altronate dehydratase [Candidatus Dactylopiibacterium carminicum]PAS93432.1 MAG: galactonate dehydratase [Candidatus Dactylopiibacterium carminicum]PAS95951.1 MAG: galactonate dehydratase [Candidatus Dactylopiibacterium carminicum]PAS99419.1 MAG: galactonate dehydratase [Candidatus Dactylopiibacterium carminicum]